MLLLLPLLLILPFSFSSSSSSLPSNSSPPTSSPSSFISFSKLNGTIVEALWCGPPTNRQKLIILTDQSIVYRRKLNGRTWENLDPKFKILFEVLKGITLEELTVRTMIKSPASDSTIFFLGSAGTSWITTDCGSHLNPIDTDSRITEVKFHPFKKELILYSAWSKKCAEESYCQKLYLSTNEGEDWAEKAQFILDFAWGIQNKDQKFISDSRILFTQYTLTDSIKLREWSPHINLFQTDDFFLSRTLLLLSGNKFILQEGNLFVARATSATEVTLFVAKMNNKRPNLQQIVLPIRHLAQKSYTIFEGDSENVFIHINHLGEVSPMGNVYGLGMGEKGGEISLSLLNNLRNKEGHCDFERIPSLPGLYIANIIDFPIATRIEEQLLESSDSFSSKPKSPKSKSKEIINEYDRFIKTMLTIDNGGIWQGLKPPPKDLSGKEIHCYGDCGLQLNVYHLQDVPPIYAKQNSVGLMLGNGNVGSFLNLRLADLNTYLSEDGGVSWKQIAEGVHTYEFGDHGGIILIAPSSHFVDYIKYSLDYGDSFTLLPLNQTLLIKNIITEESNTGLHFLLYGSSVTGEGLTFSINFGNLGLPTCASTDYEEWTPFSQTSCLLGEQKVFRRRKKSSACFSAEKEEKVVSSRPCPCTYKDYNCQEGYVRDEVSFMCMGKSVVQKIPCKAGFQILPSGYQKIIGNKCEGGIQPEIQRIPCQEEGGKREELGGRREEEGRRDGKETMEGRVGGVKAEEGRKMVWAVLGVGVGIAVVYWVWEKKRSREGEFLMLKEMEGKEEEDTGMLEEGRG